MGRIGFLKAGYAGGGSKGRILIIIRVKPEHFLKVKGVWCYLLIILSSNGRKRKSLGGG